MKQPFDDIAKKYNLLNDLISLGLHRFWKNSLVKLLIEGAHQDSKVLDVATGTGDVARLFLEKFPSEHVYAVDPSEAMMLEGKKKYPMIQHWYRGEAESLPFPDTFFSLSTCTFGVRNFRDRSLAFKELARTLVSGGRLGILEIHPIPKKFQYLPFRLFWKMGIPLWGKIFKQDSAYKYLRDTAAQFISPEVMVEELKPYFDIEHKRSLIGGGLVTLIVARKR